MLYSLNPIAVTDFLTPRGLGGQRGSSVIEYSNYYLYQSAQEIHSQDIVTAGFRKTAYDAMKVDADAAQSFSPNSVRDGGPTTCNGGTDVALYCTEDTGIRYDYNDVLIPQRNNILATSILYAYQPSQTAYAVTAINLIKHLTVDTATLMNPNGDLADTNNPIELYITICGILYGASFVMKFWESYEPSSHTTFKTWVNNFMDSITNGTNNTQPNNKKNWYTTTWASCAALLEDSTELQGAIDYHKSWFTTFFAADGTINGDRERTDNLEGLGYSMYALNAMAMLCEICRINGFENLWDYTAGGDSLEKSLDFHVTYLSDDGTLWAGLGWQQNDMSAAISEAKGVYELAYSYFGKASYKSIVDIAVRPVDYRVYRYATLTHGIT